MAYRRRCIFVHGYDARGPDHYLPLLRRGARIWAEREGRDVAVGDDAVDEHVARVEIVVSGEPDVVCSIECLRWDRQARATVPRGWARRLGGVRLAVDMVRLGVFGPLWRSGRPLALASVAHGLFTAAVTLAAIAAFGAAAAVALGASLPWLLLPLPFAALAFAVTRHAGLWALRWVGAGMAHELAVREGDPLLASPHGRALIAHLSAALVDDVDEAIVVAHCSGTRLAVSLLAEALARLPDGGRDRPVRLLTLAQPSMAVVARLAAAHGFRAHLRALARHRRLDWVDVSSPIDGSNAALVDPVRATFGSDAGGGARTFNAWFKASLEPETYAALRADRYATHFRYLAVPDRPDGRNLDLFDMLLRAQPALARYERPEETGPFYASRKVSPWTPLPTGAATSKP